MKVISCRLYHRVLLDGLGINMSEQNSIIWPMSLTHTQLSATVFRPMIQYTWYASNYIDKHPGSFKTVGEVCFSEWLPNSTYNISTQFLAQSHAKLGIEIEIDLVSMYTLMPPTA